MLHFSDEPKGSNKTNHQHTTKTKLRYALKRGSRHTTQQTTQQNEVPGHDPHQSTNNTTPTQ